MKATGIVRRIDDLGRIVIPKEIRRSFRIKEGDPLEIFTDAEGEVIFKKYSPIGELSNFASQYAEVLHKSGVLGITLTTGHLQSRRFCTYAIEIPAAIETKTLSAVTCDFNASSTSG